MSKILKAEVVFVASTTHVLDQYLKALDADDVYLRLAFIESIARLQVLHDRLKEAYERQMR